LCRAVGEVKDIDVSFGKGGRMNAVVVLFARRSDAVSCVEKFNGAFLYPY
jgi:hypothetical protein